LDVIQVYHAGHGHEAEWKNPMESCRGLYIAGCSCLPILHLNIEDVSAQRKWIAKYGKWGRPISVRAMGFLPFGLGIRSSERRNFENL
jgi:hypothetical protein